MDKPVEMTRREFQTWYANHIGWTCEECGQNIEAHEWSKTQAGQDYFLGCLDPHYLERIEAPNPLESIAEAYLLAEKLDEIGRICFGEELVDLRWSHLNLSSQPHIHLCAYDVTEIVHATPVQRCQAYYYAVEGTRVVIKADD